MVETLSGVAHVDAADVDAAASSLTSLDAWKVHRAADGLARGWLGDPEVTTERAAQELEKILLTHRVLQRRSGDYTAAERQVLADLHSAWLPTYASALEGFQQALAPSVDLDLDASARDRRRLLARACAPFCQLLGRELAAAAGNARAARGRELVAPAFLAAFAEHLIDRFELSVGWAVEADENVAFARLGISKDSATVRDHLDYFERTFRDAGAYHAFYLRFPVLARWLAAVTRMLCDSGTRLLKRLGLDVGEIGAELFGEGIDVFTSVTLGNSDYHAGGNSVAIIDVLLESGPAALVYKPRCLASERAVQDLLGRLADDGVIGFARCRVLAKDGYGYEERIPANRNDAGTRAQAAQIYQEMGGLLAVFYVLGGSDLHYENIMVANGHAFACDCETVLGVTPPGREPATGTVLDSVYRTALLDWPLPPTADIVLKLSGCTGGEAYEVPFAVPRLQEGPALAVKYETGVRVEQASANRIYVGGQLIEPRDFAAAITEGFCKVYDWFRDTQTARECVARAFAGTEARLVARSTQVYSHLLIACRHPRCLTEPLEVDLVFARLREAPYRWDKNGLAAAAEARSLWQLDVPTFAACATGTELLHDHAATIAVGLDRSPLQAALDRISALSAEDRHRQVGYIRGSFSVAEVHSPAFTATALEYARVVADELCRQLEDAAHPVRWSYAAPGSEPHDVQGSLYNGGGVALFLAYMDSIQPCDKFRRAARSALSRALCCAPEGIGAFDGLAGQVYVLAHLYTLWGDAELLARAIEVSRRLDALIDADRDYDVLSGSAGVIAVMLSLDAVSGAGLDTAHRCARHLLRHAEPVDAGLSWAPKHRREAEANLTGFAHGAAGVGWALIGLGAATGHDDYVHAGRRAFAYERLYFDDEQRDWYDLRASTAKLANGRRHFANGWCNGAPGIGLSRLASWVALGRSDDALLDETHLALSSTLRNFTGAANDTLCHGRSGNAELLLRFARARDEPAFQLEANMHAQAHWRRVASCPDWPRLEDGRESLAGLMAGMAGIGMHFLRLAEPGRVPSPLLLDPPAVATLAKGETRDVR